MSGVAITTFGLPPYLESFASMSPRARETERRPGSTLIGPGSYCCPVELFGDGSGMKLKFW